MDDVFVGRVMSTDVHSVDADASVRDAARTMLEHDIGSVVVVDGANHLRGILTTTDFVKITAEGSPTSETPVSTYMSTDVVTTTVNDSIRDVADLMVERGFHHVPVVDGTEGVVGMITSTDLTAYLSHPTASRVR
ncbi:MAG: CBS domain-containing protein [Salinigranum sp.]